MTNFIGSEKQVMIRIGTIYKLNDKYSKDYRNACISYDPQSEETIVELISSWNSTYNKTVKIKDTDPLDVAKEYMKLGE